MNDCSSVLFCDLLICARQLHQTLTRPLKISCPVAPPFIYFSLEYLWPQHVTSHLQRAQSMPYMPSCEAGWINPFQTGRKLVKVTFVSSDGKTAKSNIALNGCRFVLSPILLLNLNQAVISSKLKQVLAKGHRKGWDMIDVHRNESASKHKNAQVMLVKHQSAHVIHIFIFESSGLRRLIISPLKELIYPLYEMKKTQD